MGGKMGMMKTNAFHSIVAALSIAIMLSGLTNSRAAGQEAAPPASAEINAFDLKHNVTANGEVGVLLHLEFALTGARGQEAHAAVYFKFAGGGPLRDFDGRYRSDDGNVAVSSTLNTPYDRNEYTFDLHLPYRELHLGPGVSDLACWLSVLRQTDGAWQHLARSADRPFQVNTPAPAPIAQLPPSPGSPNADPMPGPNYRWPHGQRYTETALIELAQWFNRHPQVTPGWDFWRQQTMNDIEREKDWKNSTFSGLGSR